MTSWAEDINLAWQVWFRGILVGWQIILRVGFIWGQCKLWMMVHSVCECYVFYTWMTCKRRIDWAAQSSFLSGLVWISWRGQYNWEPFMSHGTHKVYNYSHTSQLQCFNIDIKVILRYRLFTTKCKLCIPKFLSTVLSELLMFHRRDELSNISIFCQRMWKMVFSVSCLVECKI